MRKAWSRLPSLNSLRIFEAAARHLSFTVAATELHVTQAAVSRQVRELESHLGLPLFVRLHRRVELTENGRKLASELASSFAAIARSVDEVRGQKRQSLRLSVEPAFAARWLMPRLSRFISQHSDVDLDIESSPLLREVGRETDLAIRHMDGPPRRMQANTLLLAEITCYPVAAPTLLGKGKALRRPADLARFLLLHEDDGRYWQRWLQVAEAGDLGPAQRVRLNDVALVIQGAVDGQGVALGDDLLAGDDLRAGRLVKMFDIELRAGAYWLLGPAAEQRTAAQRAFIDWLRRELSGAA